MIVIVWGEGRNEEEEERGGRNRPEFVGGGGEGARARGLMRR